MILSNDLDPFDNTVSEESTWIVKLLDIICPYISLNNVYFWRVQTRQLFSHLFMKDD
jgi:hypothetical protein